MTSPPLLTVRLLGGFAVTVAGQDVASNAWQQRRAAAVVKLLALQPQHRLHREVLMETLWPDLDGEPAANNLRVAMHRARQRLEDAGAPAGRFLTRQQDDVILGDPSEVWVDVERFSQAAHHAWLDDDPALTQAAVDHYAGDLLPEDVFEDWAAHRRTDLRISYLALLNRLAQLHEARADFSAAIAATQKLLTTEPLDEAGHANLMRLYALVGAHRQALAQYDSFAALLLQELDAEPEATTTALRDEIRALSQSTPHPSPGVPLQPLPVPALDILAENPDFDGLIGRERELAELARLLERHRLVSLLGPAGVGKTRLAEVLLATERARGRAGHLVELAAISRPDLVIGEIADALGITERDIDTNWETLVAAIGQANLLLVLDNFEQVLDAASLVADLLRACPRLSIIVTSRERLRLRAEHLYQVSPLALPEPTAARHELVASYPAVSLFLQRANDADSNFTPSDSNLSAIAEICRRLDGLPLAIELAAARVRVLPPESLLAHLAQPLPLLTGGPRDAPARQRTMRAAIAWSVDLLPSDSRSLFQRLGCFPDGFSLDAVQEVAGSGIAAEDLSSMPLLDLLEDLLDKHLLRRVDTDPESPRFAMLTVIREYAAELLEGTGEAQEIRLRHANYYQALASEQTPLLTTDNAAAAVTTLKDEHPNLRAAMATFLNQGDNEPALRMATALWRFWSQSGFISEGRGWLAQGLEAAEDRDTDLAAAALDADGVLAFAQGDFATARHRHEAALQIARSISDETIAARALVNLGALADEQGMPEQAARYLEEALLAGRAAGDERAIAVSLANLGQVAMSLADYSRAAALLNESVLAFRSLGDPRSEAAILANLGLMSLMTGDAALARHCHEEALRVFRDLGDASAEATELLNLGHAIQLLGNWPEAESHYLAARDRFEELGDRGGLAFAELHLGKLALLRGDHDAANAHLVLALGIAEEINDWVATAETLEGLAMLQDQAGEPLRAASTLGAAKALRESLSVPVPAIHQPAVDACWSRLELALSPASLAEARTAGDALVRRHFASLESGDATTSLLALSVTSNNANV